MPESVLAFHYVVSEHSQAIMLGRKILHPLGCLVSPWPKVLKHSFSVSFSFVYKWLVVTSIIETIQSAPAS